MIKVSSDKMLQTAQKVLLIFFSVLFVLKAFSTLKWRMEHDTPLLHYAAFLIDKHQLVPYRDIFETSMPGTFFFHLAVGKLFGYGDIAFRYVDLVLLMALLGATYAFMSRFGRLTAIWSAIIFGLIYFSLGQSMSLQRDYIGIIPIAFSLLCIPVKNDRPVRLSRFAIIGFLAGLSILIKPHLGIALPIVFGTLLACRWGNKKKSSLDFIECALITGATFIMPTILALLWLNANSALKPFMNIFFQYIPLHNMIAGDLRIVTGVERVVYLITKTLLFGGYGYLLLCSAFAAFGFSSERNKNFIHTLAFKCILLCTIVYAFYPTLAGKFWDYHYMPFIYFCSLLAGLSLYNWPHTRGVFVNKTKHALLLFSLLITLILQLPLRRSLYALESDLHSQSISHAPKGGRVDEIAEWLNTHIRPGDTVQPLDWVGGSVHGMLIAEAGLATQFIADYHFYHHISSPYIQKLRQSFISQLNENPPRFIIEVLKNKPWVKGQDTTRDFPELRRLLNDFYDIAHRGNGYLIYERTVSSRFMNSSHN